MSDIFLKKKDLRKKQTKIRKELFSNINSVFNKKLFEELF